MVIIKKDDYISFINSPGVNKMSITPVSNDNISTSLGNNGEIGTNVSSDLTLAADGNIFGMVMSKKLLRQQPNDPQQPQSEKMQQYTNELKQIMQQQQNPQQQFAKAQLNCRPNSHPFPSRTLLLEPGKPVKIGRAIARTKASDNNAIFDCKVLSRNHAELWYEEGKFFLKDTGSSNGTFINNQRLSQTCQSSEPFEVSSGDIVQFGVDVMENSRKETHGCIIANLKLYLPDGREGKASQSTVVGASNAKIPQVDLYRLNQYIQEAIQREQSLESKLMHIQKKIDLVKTSSSLSWQALVDEDRLLSRIDHLEKKLLCFSKPLSDDKLREEIMKLQNEKMLYQTSAKQALKKVYNERMEAIQKLSSIENALCSTENECSLLRDELIKTQSKTQETTEKLDVIQNQLEDKVSDYEEKIYKKDAELKNLSSELNEIQEKLGNYKQQELSEFENSQMMSNWLLKSDIKNIEGSDDIIKAICGDEDDESNLAKCLENNCSHIYSKMFALEKELNLLFTAININNNFNNNINNNNETSTNNGSESSIELTSEDSSKTDNQSENVPSSPKSLKSEESLILDNSQDNSQQPQCDDNQNNMNNLLMSNALNINNSTERIRVSLKQLLALYAKLKRQLVEFGEVKSNEQSSYKSKCDEMSSQLMTMKLELDSRPTLEDFDVKVQQCNELRMELSNLTDQMKSNEKLLEQMHADLNEERELRMKMLEKCLEERAIQTEGSAGGRIESTNQVPEMTHENQVIDSEIAATTSTAVLTSSEMESHENDDDALNNHPKVLYEDELVLFKEKCTNLSQENVQLHREIDELRTNMSQFHYNWLHNLMLKYLVPVLICFVAYIFYLLK